MFENCLGLDTHQKSPRTTATIANKAKRAAMQFAVCTDFEVSSPITPRLLRRFVE